jgi:hypothetical protein
MNSCIPDGFGALRLGQRAQTQARLILLTTHDGYIAEAKARNIL